MSHTLTLDVSEEVYTLLVKAAKQTGQLPETLANELLTAVTRKLTDDPVEQFIGALKSPVSDWADKHDEYIGNVIMGIIPNAKWKGRINYENWRD